MFEKKCSPEDYDKICENLAYCEARGDEKYAQIFRELKQEFETSCSGVVRQLNGHSYKKPQQQRMLVGFGASLEALFPSSREEKEQYVPTSGFGLQLQAATHGGRQDISHYMRAPEPVERSAQPVGFRAALDAISSSPREEIRVVKSSEERATTVEPLEDGETVRMLRGFFREGRITRKGKKLIFG